MSGYIGNLPEMPNMELQYAQSCIPPGDSPFACGGTDVDTIPGVETAVFMGLHRDALRTACHTGTVRNFKDRRTCLYHLAWRKPAKWLR